MTDRDKFVELIRQAEECPPEYDGEQRDKSSIYHCEGCKYSECTDCVAERIADYLIENGVIVPPCKVGDEIWVIDREDGEAVDISCIQFLAKSKGCIIGTAWINDLDIDETIAYHIEETQENFDCELKVYPDEDCFFTKEEAEKALKG